MYIREPFAYTRFRLRETFGLEAQFKRLSRWETLRRVAYEGYSIARYGDGELSYFLKGLDLHFQPFRKDLGERLRQGILSPKSGVLTCYNNVFHEPIRSTAHKKRKHRSYVERWIRIARKTEIRTFGDARCFRFKGYCETFDKEYIEQIKKDFRALFQNRKILFVCPEVPLAGNSFKDLEEHLKKIGLSGAQYIFIPNFDAAAFECDIVRQIQSRSGFDDIFLQCGPLATVLSYELAGTIDGRVVDVGALNTAIPEIL